MPPVSLAVTDVAAQRYSKSRYIAFFPLYLGCMLYFCGSKIFEILLVQIELGYRKQEYGSKKLISLIKEMTCINLRRL